MNVKTLKLLSGEELIFTFNGRQNCSDINGDAIAASDVYVIQIGRDQNGQLIRQFIEWPMMATPGQVVPIPVTAVATAPLEPYEELAREYTSMVTGLELPPVTPQILVG